MALHLKKRTQHLRDQALLLGGVVELLLLSACLHVKDLGQVEVRTGVCAACVQNE